MSFSVVLNIIVQIFYRFLREFLKRRRHKSLSVYFCIFHNTAFWGFNTLYDFKPFVVCSSFPEVTSKMI